jgi:hypothetical protein
MNNITTHIYDNFSPLPEDSRGWNSHGIIFEQLIEKSKPSIIVEVGSWKGASAITMCRALQKFNLNCTIYCIDTWLGAEEFWTTLSHTEDRNLMLKHGYPQIYYQFLSNIVHNNFQHYILPLPLPSNIAFNVLKHKNIQADLIYIDASHTYEDVLQDIKNYKQILKPTGIMFGDDFGAWPGVKQAVSESFGDSIQVKNNNYWVYES